MKQESNINNAFYEDLGDQWYTALNHPIALLRAENAVRTPWVINQIGKEKKTVLDVGCGAGFLTNAVALQGHHTFGVDLSMKSLAIAKMKDTTGSVIYREANAYNLPFHDAFFDVVTAMDFLEHVDNPERCIQEIARVLKPGGLFFFHTFNRTIMSWLVILKGVEWFVKNSPKNMHVYKLFIKPKELEKLCTQNGLTVTTWKGLSPKVSSSAFWKLVMTRQISENFSFKITNSLRCGYMGISVKKAKD